MLADYSIGRQKSCQEMSPPLKIRVSSPTATAWFCHSIRMRKWERILLGNLSFVPADVQSRLRTAAISQKAVRGRDTGQKPAWKGLAL